MNEIVIRCPYCEDHPRHPHCYINIEKAVFNCFYCRKGGSLKTLIVDHPHLKSTLLSPLDWKGLISRPPDPATSFTPLIEPDMSAVKKHVVKYLEKRGMTINEIITCHVLYSPNLPHRAVFPALSGGPAFFWTARSTTSQEPKWLFPSDGATKIRKEEYIWGLDNMREEEDIWVAEGVFDALAVRGVAVLGKKPSNLQIQMLLSKRPRRIIIAFDNDALADAKELQTKLRSLVPTGMVFPPQKHKDFGDMLKEGWRRP